jgi:hypothetical protein
MDAVVATVVTKKPGRPTSNASITASPPIIPPQTFHSHQTIEHHLLRLPQNSNHYPTIARMSSRRSWPSH